jgi:AraC-like DNA-binding protein
MARRPNRLSQRPAKLELQDPRGDALADLLGAVLLRNAMYKRIDARAPWGLQKPTRDRAIFYLVAYGSALLEVDGESPRRLVVGDVAFLPHGTGHTLRDAATTQPDFVGHGRPGTSRVRAIGGTGAASSFITGFFELDHGRRPALLERMPRVVTMTSTKPPFDPLFATTVKLLLSESSAPGQGSAIVLQRLADVLFVQALRALATCPSDRDPGLRALADPHIAQALDLIHARIDESWTVASLARRVGLSRSSFAARFSKLVGDPPLQYLARWRIARAAEDLRGTDDAVGAIAARVGYESVPSFTQAFKRWQGASPGAYRRVHRAS